MAEYLSPGVYVEEYDNSPRAMEGVGTSTAGFVGITQKGPVSGAPVLITSFAEFTRQFGGYLSEFFYGEYRYLPGAVEQFFANGGTRCYVARVIPSDAKPAKTQAGILRIQAANPGEWGNRIVVSISTVAKRKMQLMAKEGERIYTAKSTEGFQEGDLVRIQDTYNRIVSILDKTVTFQQEFPEEVVDNALVPQKVLYLVELDMQVSAQEETEAYSGLNFNRSSGNYIETQLEKSTMIQVELEEAAELSNPVEQILGTGLESGSIGLSGGSDGSISSVNAGTFIGEDQGPGRRTGIQAYLENSIVSILAVPGITMPEVIVSLVSHCENTASRFAVLDMPKDIADTGKLMEYREMIDSTYAAMYHPWIQNFDRASQKSGYFPPSGAVMGVYSRTDVARGVHKAPANETVSCTGLNINFTKGEQDILNPAGVNLIRALPGQGIRIWGARTASSNASFKYVNVRRLFIFVEESIKANTSWVVFEPNDSTLWSRVRITVSSFLENLWRSGMLVGSTPAESFFVEIGPSTMTNADIMNGRLICNIGIAPSRPAEFVIFRLTQFTAEAGTEG